MDYENEFNEIINAVKSEIKTQKEDKNFASDAFAPVSQDVVHADESATSSNAQAKFDDFIAHSDGELASFDEDFVGFDEITPKVTEQNSQNPQNSQNHKSEIEFLNAVRERILVLFEGLNAFDKGDIEARIELNLKFMEFLLASIENRLKNLSK